MSTVDHTSGFVDEEHPAAVQPTPSLAARLQRWSELTEDKRGLEAQLRIVADELNAMEPALLEDMALSGMSKATVGSFTIYTKREFFAEFREGVDKKAVMQSWMASGRLERLVMLGHQALRGLVNECGKDGTPLPEQVSQFVEIGERFRLRARKE